MQRPDFLIQMQLSDEYQPQVSKRSRYSQETRVSGKGAVWKKNINYIFSLGLTKRSTTEVKTAWFEPFHFFIPLKANVFFSLVFGSLPSFRLHMNSSFLFAVFFFFFIIIFEGIHGKR